MQTVYKGAAATSLLQHMKTRRLKFSTHVSLGQARDVAGFSRTCWPFRRRIYSYILQVKVWHMPCAALTACQSVRLSSPATHREASPPTLRHQV